MTRFVVLCADDYALTPGISRAIIDLAVQGRLSAISCMTGSPLWATHAPWLRPLIGKVDIGLHITLVDEVPLTSMPRLAPHGKLPGVAALILKSYAGMIDLGEIEREITAQWDAFELALGRPPDHIDGHLHTHVLPGIRDAVLRIAARRAPKAWLRNVSEPLGRIIARGIAVPKASLISVLGRALPIETRLPTNDGFSGIYGLRGDENLESLFARFLESPAARPVVMCHPSDCASETVACATARTNEYAFLGSSAFAALLSTRGLSVERFS